MSSAIQGRLTQIKLIQRGTITMGNGVNSNTATITSVDTAKAVLTLLGNSNDATDVNDPSGYNFRLTLTNATTVTCDRTAHDTITATVAFQVVEFY